MRVLERGQDLVLAAHCTPIGGRIRATTMETVPLRSAPSDQLPAGPRACPYAVETFTLEQVDDHTLLTYTGQLGTDLWRLGERWGDLVAAKWVAVVAAAFEATKTETERRHRARPGTARGAT